VSWHGAVLLLYPFTSSGIYKGRDFVINISYFRMYFSWKRGAFCVGVLTAWQQTEVTSRQQRDLRGGKRKKKKCCVSAAAGALCPSDNPSLKQAAPPPRRRPPYVVLGPATLACMSRGAERLIGVPTLPIFSAALHSTICFFSREGYFDSAGRPVLPLPTIEAESLLSPIRAGRSILVLPCSCFVFLLPIAATYL